MGRCYSAIESYDMALSINSRFASAWYNRGNAHASIGIYTRAMEDYLQSLTYNNKDVFALYNLANAYEQLGKYDEAIATFSRAIRTDANHFESYFGRGNCYYHLSEYKKALDDYDFAITLYADNADLWYAKADAEYNLGAIHESIESYWKVLALDSKNYDASLDLCDTLIETEEYELAAPALDELIKHQPDWSEPHYSKAKLHFLTGDTEDGIVELETGFLLSPTDRFEYDFERDWEKVLQFLISRDE